MSDGDFVIPFGRLPDGFAESVEHPPEVPATPRAAATVVLMRDGTAGPEVLLMRRTRRAGFVPGTYVFPGGRVDAGDANAELVARIDGLTPEQAADRLELRDAEPSAIAYYLAAIREAFEETGILIARSEVGEAPPTAADDPAVDEVRSALMEGRLGFAEALDRLRCRVAGDAVEYLAHWITPEAEPRRYDTRFFLATVDAGARPIVDPREMTDACWLRPRDALARQAEGSLPMVFPTIKTLGTLGGYGSARDALTDLGPRAVPTILPRLVITPTGVGMDLGDEG